MNKVLFVFKYTGLTAIEADTEEEAREIAEREHPGCEFRLNAILGPEAAKAISDFATKHQNSEHGPSFQ